MIDLAPMAYVAPFDAALTDTKLLNAPDRPKSSVAWFDAIPVPLVGFDARGSIYLWNTAAAELFGWTAGEVFGTPGELIPEDLRPVHRTHLDRVFSAGGIAGELLVARHRDGTSLVLKASAKLTAEGALFTLLHVEPVPQPLPADPEESEDHRSATLGRLLPGIAHDVNNLLTVMCGYAELLAEQLDPSDTRRELADLIADLGKQAGEFLTYVNSLGKPAGEVSVQLPELFLKVGRLLPRYVGPNVRLSVECASTLGSIAVDPIEALQVVLNLVGNARDATGPGGAIAVRVVGKQLAEASPGWPQTVPTGRFAVVTVSDSGCGMDDTILPRIFEPRFTTRADRGGTGLGLSTVARIVERGGGFIQVETEPDWGTRFRIFFPMR